MAQAAGVNIKFTCYERDSHRHRLAQPARPAECALHLADVTGRGMPVYESDIGRCAFVWLDYCGAPTKRRISAATRFVKQRLMRGSPALLYFTFCGNRAGTSPARLRREFYGMVNLDGAVAYYVRRSVRSVIAANVKQRLLLRYQGGDAGTAPMRTYGFLLTAPGHKERDLPGLEATV
jgi:hypothetical protein